jgi:putative hemolysin
MSSLQSALVVLAVVLLFGASWLALAETSLSRIDRYRAQALVDEKRRGSTALFQLVESPERFSVYLNAVLLLLLSTQITAATVIAYLLLELIGGPIVILAVVVEVLVGYVVAEAMPKTWAVQHPERCALWTAPIIAALGRVLPMGVITRPLIWLANVLLPGKGLAEGPFIYEQQILALADTAAHEKVIEKDEYRLIHSVIEFGSTIVREVMIPRTDMLTLGSDISAHDAMDVAIAKGYSRMPVHSDENEQIIGTLFTKDLMRAVRDGHGALPVSHLLRPPMFIPETKRVAELLREMQREKFHMAIVVDEYGSVVGLVTLEDLVEEVVGEITDEYDVEQQPQIEQVNDDEWRIDARMGIDEVFEQINVRLPHGDWDTVGGLLINVFGRVPNRGEFTEVDEYKISVEQTSGRRVSRVRIRREPVIDESTATVGAGDVEAS